MLTLSGLDPDDGLDGARGPGDGARRHGHGAGVARLTLMLEDRDLRVCPP